MRTYQKVASLARDFTTSQGKERKARADTGDKAHAATSHDADASDRPDAGRRLADDDSSDRREASGRLAGDNGLDRRGAGGRDSGDGDADSRDADGRDANRGGGNWRGRVKRYAPLVGWIAFIFFASSDSMSASKTSRIVRPLLLWLFPAITEEGLLYAHFLVRKAAHLTEYALLALLAARAFLTSSHALLRRRWVVVAIVFVACCALLDEYHQSFLASRTGTIYDSLLDTTGGAIAIALVVIWRRLALRRSVRNKVS